jgi:hypothetical protein
MKNATLTYSQVFKRTPISPWIGVSFYLYGQTNNPNEDFGIPVRSRHPIDSLIGPWCQLKVHYNNVNLVFSLPVELDHFIEILDQKLLPNGPSLYKFTKVGRPHSHWLARLPKKAKPYAFRQQLIEYLNSSKEVKSFREFYQNREIQTHYPDHYSTYAEAKIAIDNVNKQR